MIPRWVRAALVIVLTFAAGAAAGVGYDQHRAPARAVPVMDATHVLHMMQLALALDSSQSAQVSAILARHQHAVDSTWRALQPGVKASMDSTLREIIAVLKPDQAGKFRTMVRVMHHGMIP